MRPNNSLLSTADYILAITQQNPYVGAVIASHRLLYNRHLARILCCLVKHTDVNFDQANPGLDFQIAAAIHVIHSADSEDGLRQLYNFFVLLEKNALLTIENIGLFSSMRAQLPTIAFVIDLCCVATTTISHDQIDTVLRWMIRKPEMLKSIGDILHLCIVTCGLTNEMITAIYRAAILGSDVLRNFQRVLQQLNAYRILSAELIQPFSSMFLMVRTDNIRMYLDRCLLSVADFSFFRLDDDIDKELLKKYSSQISHFCSIGFSFVDFFNISHDVQHAVGQHMTPQAAIILTELQRQGYLLVHIENDFLNETALNLLTKIYFQLEKTNRLNKKNFQDLFDALIVGSNQSTLTILQKHLDFVSIASEIRPLCATTYFCRLQVIALFKTPKTIPLDAQPITVYSTP